MASAPAKRPKPVAKKSRGGVWSVVKWLLFLSIAGAAMAAGAVLLIFLVYGSDPDLPRLDRVADYKPKVVTKILSADGELIGEIFDERRTVVPREKIPAVMIHAIVDAEDAQFYEHSGLSYIGLLRAVLRDLRPGAHLQGASTITQQLVRNLILHSTAQTVKRKVQEMILSLRIESAMTKDEILYLYLNQIDFGHQRFGVEEAARFYFGKGIADVTAGEAALLSSLPKGPSEIDPWRHPERAKDRQKYVLSQMVRYNHLSEGEAEKFARAPIEVVKAGGGAIGSAPEFVDEVKKILIERFGLKQLATLGLIVETTCDSKIQKLTRETLEKGLVELDGRHGFRKPSAHLKGAALAEHLSQLKKEYPTASLDKIIEGVIVGLSDAEATVDVGAYKGTLPLGADRYNPKNISSDKRFAVGDVVRVRAVEIGHGGKSATFSLELGPQAAAVVIDPNTREVKAIVGGYHFLPSTFNRATQAKRQPGSSFKPFVYGAAFATGKFTPASILDDSPQTYVTPGLQPWKPANAEKEEYLGPIRLRVALAKSINTIASQLVDVQRGGVDPEAVVEFAHECGIESQLGANPSLALGASEVRPIELTNAYATFASGGKRMAPVLIRKIGNDAEPSLAPMPALKPELAYVMTSMMMSVIEEGTAISAKGKLGRPAAGKTGTVVTKNGLHSDAWFVGYTPDLVTGVWVGFDDHHELGHGEQGSRAALPIWTDIMIGALKGRPPQPFSQPPGVVVQKIDAKTGLLAAPGAPGIDEVFLEGTAPTQVAPVAGEANPDTYIIDQ